jgi:excisionase family DNA binding protein
MLERLTNPLISLHEASVLLGVCAATVRRYTVSGVLPHVRTTGGQRRFRLRDVLTLERERKAKRK